MTHNDKNKNKVLVAVDCIIFGFDQKKEELQLLLIKRDFEPEIGKWSLMGGFMGIEETIKTAATRVLHELTGLTNVYMEQLKVYSDLMRDPAERTISVGYYALINIEDHKEEMAKRNLSQMSHSASWFEISKVPKLIFDHNIMVENAIQRLRYRTSVQPIGFELLPEKFTMRQLQKLYEQIYGEKLDKRNFIKKINSLNIIEKLDEKDKNSSRRGSFLFRFNQEKFLQHEEYGFSYKA